MPSSCNLDADILADLVRTRENQSRSNETLESWMYNLRKNWKVKNLKDCKKWKVKENVKGGGMKNQKEK